VWLEERGAHLLKFKDDPFNHLTLTSCVAEVFETIIDKRLGRHDSKHKIISDLQGASTSPAK